MNSNVFILGAGASQPYGYPSGAERAKTEYVTVGAWKTGCWELTK